MTDPHEPATKLPDSTPSEAPESVTKKYFPHDDPTDHWDADYGDSHQVYEGAELPIWLLAGWATFIIWAVIYLFSGLPTAFN